MGPYGLQFDLYCSMLIPQSTHGRRRVLCDEADKDSLVDGSHADANLAVLILAQDHLEIKNTTN